MGPKLSILPLLLSLLLPQLVFANTQAVLDEQGAANREARDSQRKIDGLSDQAQKALEEFSAAARRTENLRIYNQQMERYIESQEQEKESIRRQIVQVAETSQGIVPLMLNMLDTLEEFITLDTPFLLEERTGRLAELREMMDRADVTISEKYRRVLEAFQTEAQYGRTIEAYRGVIDRDGREMTVDFLRIGRVTLVYQSLDGRTQGLWDKHKGEWVNLAGSYRRDIYNAIRVARQQVAPDLIKVPVFGPERL